MMKRGVIKAGIVLILVLSFVMSCIGAQASSMDAVWPESPGIDVRNDGKLVVDASHMDQGYVMVRSAEPTKHGLKVVISSGKWQLNYDLNSNGEYEAFPLQKGSGNYDVSLFENVKGNKYSSEGRVSLSVQLVNEDAPFLVPNQYVSYELWTSAVQKSDELCADQPAQKVFDAVTNFMASEFSYDFVRAKTVSSGQLPEIDYCYDNRMGICQDLAAVMVCMLRVQGVPAKLEIGYADKYYHAWTSSVIDGKEVFFDPTNAIGAINAKKYQIEREY